VQQLKTKSFSAIRDRVTALHSSLVDTTREPQTLPGFAPLCNSRDQKELLALQDRAHAQRWMHVEPVQAENASLVPTSEQCAIASRRSRGAAGGLDPKDPDVLWATPFHVRWRHAVWQLPVCSFGTAFTKPLAGSSFYLLSEKHGYSAEMLRCVMLDDTLAELVLPFDHVGALDLLVQQRPAVARSGKAGLPMFIYTLVFDRSHPRRFSVHSSRRVFYLAERAARERRGRGHRRA